MTSTEAPLAPRILAKPAAATYCGLTEAGFDHWVATGKLPGAMKGTRRWDRTALDLALDRLSGIDRSKPMIATPESALAKFKIEQAARESAKAARPVEPPLVKRRGANRERTSPEGPSARDRLDPKYRIGEKLAKSLMSPW